MTWQQPWAWIGAAAVAVPILIHLLGRRRPRPLAFPTLRFIQASKVAPARRHRLNDIPLLIVRAATIVMAAAALAQPWWPAAHPSISTTTTARAVVVDTSASMARVTADGRPAIDVARARAQAIATPAPSTQIIESPTPGLAMAGASHWLAGQRGARELIVISDFQRGAIGPADITRVPADIGLKFEPVDVAPRGEPVIGPASQLIGGAFAPAMQLTADRTTVAWAPAQIGSGIVIHAAATDGGVVDAVVTAARAEGLPVGANASNIDLFLPGATDAPALAGSSAFGERRIEDRSALRTEGRSALRLQPWMFDVIDRVRRDTTVAELAASLPDASVATRTAAADDRTATIVLRSASGRPVLVAQASPSGTTSRLQLVSTVDATDVFTPAVVLAIGRATVPGTSWTELESARIADADLRAWTRPPSTTPPAPDATTESDGRWVWMAVLALLGVEQWMRRSPVPAAEVPRARVA